MQTNTMQTNPSPLERIVEQKLLDQLYANSLGTVTSHAVFGFLTFAIFYNKLPIEIIGGWFALLMININVRYAFIYNWNKDQSNEHKRASMQKMAQITSLINGVIWASTVYFLDFIGLPHESIALSLMVVSLATLAAIYGAYFIPAFYLAVVPYFGSQIVFHIYQNNFESLIAAAILLFLAFMLYTQVKSLNQTYKSKIIQEIDNESLIEQLQKANAQLQYSSNQDFLTDVYNRRYLDEIIPRYWHRHAKSEQPFCLVICDIDHFKRFNDRFGHQKGDEILIQVANILKMHTRPLDQVFRFGGEEFVILLPDTDKTTGYEIAERLRIEIENQHIATGENECCLTMSFGISGCVPSFEERFEQLLEKADQMLYHSKSSGRNMVTLHSDH